MKTGRPRTGRPEEGELCDRVPGENPGTRSKALADEAIAPADGPSHLIENAEIASTPARGGLQDSRKSAARRQTNSPFLKAHDKRGGAVVVAVCRQVLLGVVRC